MPNQVVKEFDENEARDGHGMWTSGGGGVTAEHLERAKTSLTERAFVSRHADRLTHAGDEVRAQFPKEERAGDVAHEAAQQAIHTEAARIHAEESVHGGDAEMKAAADGAHNDALHRGEDHAQAHQRAIDAANSIKSERAEEAQVRSNEDQAIAAGHLTTEARDAADAYVAGHEARQQEIVTVASQLDTAHHDAA